MAMKKELLRCSPSSLPSFTSANSVYWRKESNQESGCRSLPVYRKEQYCHQYCMRCSLTIWFLISLQDRAPIERRSSPSLTISSSFPLLNRMHISDADHYRALSSVSVNGQTVGECGSVHRRALVCGFIVTQQALGRRWQSSLALSSSSLTRLLMIIVSSFPVSRTTST